MIRRKFKPLYSLVSIKPTDTRGLQSEETKKSIEYHLFEAQKRANAFERKSERLLKYAKELNGRITQKCSVADIPGITDSVDLAQARIKLRDKMLSENAYYCGLSNKSSRCRTMFHLEKKYVRILTDLQQAFQMQN